jgi:transposase-like protein
MLYLEFEEMFPTEEAVIDYFIKIRYPYGVTCPHCSEKHLVYPRKGEPKMFECKACHNSFSVFRDTIFEQTKADMRKWFFAINQMVEDKKGISALQLSRQIGGSYRTSWRMLKLIRRAMGNEEEKELFEAIVEIDETYIGGKPPKDKDKRRKRGRGTNKTPIIGVKEWSSGKVRAIVAKRDGKNRTLTGKQLLEFIRTACKPTTTIISDEFSGYRVLNHHKTEFFHLTINHSLRQYSDHEGTHTNGIESVWELIKRGLYGVYHHVDVKYLQDYINEFSFRLNNKDNPDVFDTLLKQTIYQ